MKLPIVAIIGLTNAGKSTLLNRLAKKNLAITAREEGTTRDNVVAKLDDYILIDTAGLKDPEDDFESGIQAQITEAIDAADLILVLIDGTKHPDDHTLRIIRQTQKSKKPYLIALNKSDLGASLPDSEFRHFGEPNLLRLSATTGQGITELTEQIHEILSLEHTTSQHQNDDVTFMDSPLRIALIGRPNVGKSSLFNALARKQQALVSSRQGTTRDINRVELRFKGQTLEFLDTAGLRKPGKREVGIEKFSAVRTLAAIEESDICLLLIDATEPHAKLDQSLAGQIVDAGKSIILVVTKSDLIPENDEDSPDLANANLADVRSHDEDRATSPVTTGARSGRQSGVSKFDQILNNLERDFNFLPYAPVIITSSTTDRNVSKIFDLATQIAADRHTSLKTSDLNKILEQATKSHPPAGLKNTRPKLRYITQTDTAPPWFTVYGSELQLLHWSYKRYLERQIRTAHPFVGTPIFFSFKNRNS